MKDYLL